MANIAVVQVKGQGSRLHIGLLVSETLFSFIDHRSEGGKQKTNLFAHCRVCRQTAEYEGMDEKGQNRKGQKSPSGGKSDVD